MVVSLYYGNMQLQPDTRGYLLDTDIGHPVQGPPGVVALWKQGEMVEGRYLGYHSPKSCIPEYLAAVSDLLQTYRTSYQDQELMVRCHSWTSGIGRVLLSDIIRLSQPSKVTEYHSSQAIFGTLSKLTTTFLPTMYPFPSHISLSQISIEPRKISDYKQLRTATLLRSLSPSVSVVEAKPWVGQLERLTVLIQKTQVTATALPEYIGRICGLSTSSKRCLGLGLVRDVNPQTGLIWVVSALSNMKEVETIEVVTGDGALELDWTEAASVPSPYILQAAIDTQTRQKFHPNRSYS